LPGRRKPGMENPGSAGFTKTRHVPALLALFALLFFLPYVVFGGVGCSKTICETTGLLSVMEDTPHAPSISCAMIIVLVIQSGAFLRLPVNRTKSPTSRPPVLPAVPGTPQGGRQETSDRTRVRVPWYDPEETWKEELGSACFSHTERGCVLAVHL